MSLNNFFEDWMVSVNLINQIEIYSMNIYILEKFKNNEDRFEKTIEYSFDEIEIRIESLKIQLDNLLETLLLELESFEKSLLRFVN